MNEQNLKPKPISSVEQAKIMGSKGGKASVKAKREKKLLSQVYGEFLAEKFSVTIDGRSKKVTGAEFLKYVARKIAARGDATTVALMKEIREATEGSKMQTAQEIVVKLDFDTEGI